MYALCREHSKYTFIIESGLPSMTGNRRNKKLGELLVQLEPFESTSRNV